MFKVSQSVHMSQAVRYLKIVVSKVIQTKIYVSGVRLLCVQGHFGDNRCTCLTLSVTSK